MTLAMYVSGQAFLDGDGVANDLSNLMAIDEIY